MDDFQPNWWSVRKRVFSNPPPPLCPLLKDGTVTEGIFIPFRHYVTKTKSNKMRYLKGKNQCGVIWNVAVHEGVILRVVFKTKKRLITSYFLVAPCITTHLRAVCNEEPERSGRPLWFINFSKSRRYHWCHKGKPQRGPKVKTYFTIWMWKGQGSQETEYSIGPLLVSAVSLPSQAKFF